MRIFIVLLAAGVLLQTGLRVEAQAAAMASRRQARHEAAFNAAGSQDQSARPIIARSRGRRRVSIHVAAAEPLHSVADSRQSSTRLLSLRLAPAAAGAYPSLDHPPA